MSEIGNELTEMMLKLDKRNQEIMNDILNQQKEMIRDLETERPKGKMAATHQLSEKSLLYVWADETFKCTHMKKKIDDLEKLQLSMKLEFDDMGLSKNPSFFSLDELKKNHTRIEELQARERERIMIRLGFWPANPPAASPHVGSAPSSPPVIYAEAASPHVGCAPSSSTIHPETGKPGSATVLNQHQILGIDIADDEKFQHFHYLLNSLPPFLKSTLEEQMEELVMEARAKGVPLQSLETKASNYSIDEPINCDYCQTSIVDLFRRCLKCKYDVCLTCCREVRKNEPLQNLVEFGSCDKYRTHFLVGCPVDVSTSSKLASGVNGSISCGCGSLLELMHIFHKDWISTLKERADCLLETINHDFASVK